MKYLVVREEHIKNSYKDDFAIDIDGYKYAYTESTYYTDKKVVNMLIYVTSNNNHSIEKIQRYVGRKERNRVNSFKYFFKSLKNSIDFNYKYNNKKNRSKIFIAVSVFFKSIKEVTIRKLNDLLYKTEVTLSKLKLRIFKKDTNLLPPDRSILDNLPQIDKQEELYTPDSLLNRW